VSPEHFVVHDAGHRFDPFPLTDLQHAYLIGRGASHELGNVATHAYLEFDSDHLDPVRLKAAWRRLVSRHDMLRAVVTADGRQRVLEKVPDSDFRIENPRALASDEGEARLAAVRREYDHAVPPPHEWPLHRVVVSCLPGGRTRVHLSFDLLMIDLHSLRVLSAEWQRLYDDIDTELPKLELAFRDVVLAAHDAQPDPASVAYWTGRLPDLPGGPDLPVLPRRSGTRRFTRRSHRLDSAAWMSIRALARAHGVTPSVALLTAYSAVLGTWSGAQRFCVNVITQFNRPASPSQAAALVGDFTSLDPLEVDTASAGSFTELAVAVQRRLWADLEHQDFSGVRVLRELARLHGTPTRAMLPVVFTSGLGAEARMLPFHWLGQPGYSISQTPQVVLDHQAFDDDDGVYLLWDASEDHFPAAVLDDMFAAYLDLLRELADPAGWAGPPSARLPGYQIKERERANDTAGPLPAGTLEDAVFARAAERPDATAVIAADGELSYRELTNRALGLAARMRAGGVARGDVVAINIAKGWRQIVGVLAVTRIGACYLPVSVGLPAERQEYLASHAGAVCVLTGEGGAAWPTALPSYPVRAADPGPVGMAGADLAGALPGDVAYIIYTSGSTGTPKGVAVSHRAALNTCADIAERFAFGPQDRVLGLSSLSFDLSVFDIFGVLGAGACLVLPYAEHAGDPAHWLDLIRRHRPTVWNSAPVLMDLLAGHIEGQVTHVRAGGLPLRLVLLSGDWIPVSLPGRIRAVAPDARVISLGGATEAAIWSIWHPAGDAVPGCGSIPYGTPLRNQAFHALNQRLEPCPDWVPGHLYITGSGLAEGYWRDPDRTREAFPVHPGTGQRMYRTGDLGRYLPGGVIEFLGRDDHQVKIGGHRIELGEIEHALRGAPAIADAVVIAHGERNRRRLAAFVTPAGANGGEAAVLPDTEEASLLGDEFGVKITDPVARVEFKLRRPDLRVLPGRAEIPLPAPGTQAAVRAQSCRWFQADPVPLDRLAGLLGMLNEDGHASHGYGSAGGLYPVQIYLDVASERVAGLPAGPYYYARGTHRLVPLDASSGPARPGMTAISRGLAERSAFAIYLVAEHGAIEPLYGSLSRDFCLIEAGLIAQLLEMTAQQHGLGLCQVGGLRHNADVTSRFELGESHELLHALVGGLPAREPTLPLPVVLREELARRLPSYMVPGVIKVLDGLPLTVNGKVDRGALERMAVAAAADSGGGNGHDAAGQGPAAGPTIELERVIVELTAEVLGVQPASVGVSDNFFDLGADSEALTRLYSQLLARLDVTFPLLALFEAPNAGDLARRIGGEWDDRAAASKGRDRAARQAAARQRRRLREDPRTDRKEDSDEH